MMDVEEPFFGLLLVPPLEQWGVDKWDIAEVTFAYLNIISANFQLNHYSHLVGYPTYIYIRIYKYINITSSISIRR